MAIDEVDVATDYIKNVLLIAITFIIAVINIATVKVVLSTTPLTIVVKILVIIISLTPLSLVEVTLVITLLEKILT
jgi:hypothetical protein